MTITVMMMMMMVVAVVVVVVTMMMTIMGHFRDEHKKSKSRSGCCFPR